MFKKLLIASALTAFASTAAHAASVGTIAFTSFEEALSGEKYTDTLGTDSHALINNPAQSDVNYDAGPEGAELGFSSYYTSTGGVGLTDGDFVGVTNYTGTVGSYTDGTQGFQMSDTDGIMTTTLQTVDLTGFADTRVSLDVFFNADSYESSDRARIWLTVDGGTEIDLLNTAGSDIDSLGIEDMWFSLTQSLESYTTATLAFELEANAAGEQMFVDNIVFSGNAAAVPVPAAVWLLGSGMLGLIGLNRRSPSTHA
jgi:hypothetical protein